MRIVPNHLKPDISLINKDNLFINSARDRKKERARSRWRETERKVNKHSVFSTLSFIRDFPCKAVILTIMPKFSKNNS